MNKKVTIYVSSMLTTGLVITSVFTSSAAQSVFLNDCGYKYSVKPSSLTMACADGNLGIEKIKWTNWGKSVALGTGTYFYNNCTPNCAAGRFVRFKVSFSIGTIFLEKGSKKQVYSELEILGSRHPLIDGSHDTLYQFLDRYSALGKTVGPLLDPGSVD